MRGIGVALGVLLVAVLANAAFLVLPREKTACEWHTIYSNYTNSLEFHVLPEGDESARFLNIFAIVNAIITFVVRYSLAVLGRLPLLVIGTVSDLFRLVSRDGPTTKELLQCLVGNPFLTVVFITSDFLLLISSTMLITGWLGLVLFMNLWHNLRHLGAL